MFKLIDLYTHIIQKNLPNESGITCEIIDSHMASLTQELSESISVFCYSLVLQGRIAISYNGNVAILTKNDFFIYTPGMLFLILEVSKDYSALSLISDEAVAYEIPYARNVFTSSYFSSFPHNNNKITFTEKEAKLVETRLREIIYYVNSDHQFKNECLYSLYSLFLLDLLNAQNRFNKDFELNTHPADLFFRFKRLLAANFKSHHDISFYADALAVTSIYLSRIVKRFSGQTVKKNIDRLLVMEAIHLLASTDIPIAIIAEKLYFANPSSFSKFFTKHKGISPSEYRKSGSYTN